MKVSKNKPILRFKDFNGVWEGKSGSEIFINSRKKGDEGLPIYSVTLDRGMVPRNTLDRQMGNDASATDNLFVAKNDIAYNMMRMWQGAFGLAPVDCMVSPAYVVLHPKDQISSEFFINYFQRSRSLYLFTAYSYGLTSDRLRLYFKDFAQIKFLVPSLPEQQKIASFLSAIDEKIQQLTRKKALLEQYKKGVMQQLFSGKLRFKDENGKAYPKWEEKTLNSFEKLVHGDGDWILSENIDKNEKYSIVQLGNIGYGRFVEKPMKTLSEENFNLIKGTLLKQGDLLINRMVDANLYACVFNYHGLYVTSVDVCWIRQGDELNNTFLLNLMLTDKYQNKLLSLSSGSGRVRISKNNLFEKFKFMLPSIEEQQKIASFLSALDTKIETVTTQIAKTQEFKKGLLQKMLV